MIFFISAAVANFVRNLSCRCDCRVDVRIHYFLFADAKAQNIE